MLRRTLLAAGAMLAAAPALAQQPIKINWWHAMSGQLGEALDAVVADFNKSQSKYQVIATSKGNYPATLNAAIAAYRAGEHPHLLQNNEAGVLTMMLSGAIVPAHDIADLRLGEKGLPDIGLKLFQAQREPSADDVQVQDHRFDPLALP